MGGLMVFGLENGIGKQRSNSSRDYLCSLLHYSAWVGGRKIMYSSSFSLVMYKLGLTGLLRFNSTTSLGEGQFWIQTHYPYVLG